MRPVPLRVASVPAAHPYVRHLRLPRVGVELLEDPHPPGAAPGVWWPPVMLTPDWIAAHADGFELLHLHFGAESLSPEALAGALDALGAHGRPLVHTVHDLDHPQLRDQSRHRAQMDLLIPRADELITLTDGAAAEIARRWGRAATVIPHPQMASTGPSDPAPAPPNRVAVHLRDLRPNVDGPGAVAGLAGAIRRLRRDGIETVGSVHLFDHTRAPADAEEVRRMVAGHDHLTLLEGPRPTHADLEADLRGVHASVLPYRHGTHSGWAELCWDLGVPVLGADIGHIADEHDDPGWFTAVDPADPEALAAAIAALPRPGPGARAETERERRRRRAEAAPGLARAHLAVYRRALERARNG